MSAGQARNGVGGAAQNPALQGVETSQILNVVRAAPDAEVKCIKVSYSRCAPLGITELLVKRARQEPPGVRLALLAIWRTIMASLGAKVQLFEPLWVDADLDPQTVVTPEDRARAETAAEEALAPCRLCVVDLSTFLKLVRRATLVSKPSGDLILMVEVERAGNVAIIATKISKWVKETKEGVKYAVPLTFRENLHRLGLDVDADPRDLYLELVRLADHYDTVADAYLKPVLLQAIEKLKVSPFLAKCSRDGHVIYIATELFRSLVWYFNSHVGLGRNSFYEALRRHGLLASPTTVPVDLYDEYGNRVKKRALAFYIDRLSEFIEYNVESICQAASGLEAEGEEQETGGHA
jgi:hypothetical protein